MLLLKGPPGPAAPSPGPVSPAETPGESICLGDAGVSGRDGGRAQGGQAPGALQGAVGWGPSARPPPSAAPPVPSAYFPSEGT